MEGLYFESSVTTPFHFLNASEVSAGPSNPVRGLQYRPLDFDRAAAHLKLYDVRYFVGLSERAVDAARIHPEFTEVATSAPFTIFELEDSGLVEVAQYQPAVWDGGGEFLDAALDWYDDIDGLDRWVAAEGPEDWPRISNLEELDDAAPYAPAPGAVSDVVLEDHRISFTTTAVGVPHLVKVSYFPNWEASGASGPYRVAPALMLVVPTEEQVELNFGRPPAEVLGMAMSGVALVGLIGLAFWQRRKESFETAAAQSAGSEGAA
jgi:hypothetical protein